MLHNMLVESRRGEMACANGSESYVAERQRSSNQGNYFIRNENANCKEQSREYRL